jgi:hypothetical protein
MAEVSFEVSRPLKCRWPRFSETPFPLRRAINAQPLCEGIVHLGYVLGVASVL